MLTREQIFKVADERPIRPLSNLSQQKQETKQRKSTITAGPDWFDMAAVEMTQELRDDIRLLSYRSALDPSRHYKKGDKIATSQFLQVGRVVSDPSSYFTDRTSRKQRAAPTIVDSILRDVEKRQYLKRKYGNLERKAMQNGKRQGNKTTRKASPYSSGK